MTVPSGVKTLSRVWGTDPANVFAVGEAGVLLHYDGRAWEKMTSPISEWWRGVWGSGREVLVVGGCAMIRYDGTTWNKISIDAAPSGCFLNSAWGTGPADVFVAGSIPGTGLLLRYDGKSWLNTDPVDNEGAYVDVWGSGPVDVYAVGYRRNEGVMKHYDGKAWSRVSSATWFDAEPVFLNGIWGTGSSDVYAVGSQIVIHYDGNTWSKVGIGRSAWATGWAIASNDVFVLGADGNVAHYDGQGWTVTATGATAGLNSIWASGPNDAFVVGENGTILHYSCSPR